METIYLLFNSFYDQNLELYLRGNDGNAWTLPLLYNMIGLTTLLISLFLVLLYYYGINSPRLHRWWHWLIMLGMNSTITLFLGYIWTSNHLHNGHIPQSLVYYLDAQGNRMQAINDVSCWGFGISNAIIAVIFFCLLSLCLKWWSPNCNRSPF